MTTSDPVTPYRRRADEGEAYWFLGNLLTVKASGAQTRGRMSVVEVLHPPGFAPPLHRHREEDEAFYVLDGTAQFRSGEHVLDAGPGDFVLLPVGLPHTFLVGPDAPLRSLLITTPSGFEAFAAEVGEPARERRLPEPGPVDPAYLQQVADRHAVDLLGPPPTV
jgi:mannose-6-phosphate isomerase-like protein (cupin superfamily)